MPSFPSQMGSEDVCMVSDVEHVTILQADMPPPPKTGPGELKNPKPGGKALCCRRLHPPLLHSCGVRGHRPELDCGRRLPAGCVPPEVTERPVGPADFVASLANGTNQFFFPV